MNSTTTNDKNFWFADSTYDTMAQLNAYGYVLVSSVSVVGHIFVLIPLIKYPAFRARSEYITIAGMFVMDLLNSLAFLTAGVWRLYRTAVGGAQTNNLGFTIFNCAMMPHNLLWSITLGWTGWMLSVVSIERLILVTVPMWHIINASRASKIMVTTVFLVSLIWFFAVNLHALINGYDILVVSDQCFGNKIKPIDWYSFEVTSNILGYAASIAIYMVVIILYVIRSRNNSTNNSNGTLSMSEKIQRKMTQKLAFSTVGTVVTYFAPMCTVRLHNYGVFHLHQSTLGSLYVITALNPVIDVYLFFIKHSQIRLGFMRALRGQHMPVNLEQWNMATQRASITKVADTRL